MCVVEDSVRDAGVEACGVTAVCFAVSGMGLLSDCS